MTMSSIERRLSALEDVPAEEDMVNFSYQWLNEDYSPAGEMVTRRVPSSRIQNLMKWMDKK